MSVVVFVDPLEAQSIVTHFHMLVMAIEDRDALVMHEDGTLEWVSLGDVQVQLRWDERKKAWVPIVEPGED